MVLPFHLGTTFCVVLIMDAMSEYGVPAPSSNTVLTKSSCCFFVSKQAIEKASQCKILYRIRQEGCIEKQPDLSQHLVAASNLLFGN